MSNPIMPGTYYWLVVGIIVMRYLQFIGMSEGVYSYIMFPSLFVVLLLIVPMVQSTGESTFYDYIVCVLYMGNIII